jgi:hypothetical protein
MRKATLPLQPYRAFQGIGLRNASVLVAKALVVTN